MATDSRIDRGGRRAALEGLCRWEREKNQAQGLLNAALDPHLRRLDEREQRLARSLCNGILRQLQYLDHVLGGLCKHPLEKMEARTLWALRLGAFQLLFMDRMPVSAAVNETVAAFKSRDATPRWLVGFVNGVLRRLSREREKHVSKRAENTESPILNHPSWMTERWQQRFGKEEMLTICRCNNSPAPLCLRANPARITAEALLVHLRGQDLQVKPGKFAPDALYIKDFTGPVSTLPGFHEGWFAVQDEAAQLVSILMDTKSKRWLDGCAGLGGKSGHLAALLPIGGSLCAVEPDARRCNLLRSGLQRLGLDKRVDIRENTRLEQIRAGKIEPFDAILIDAPCSGSGVIRRHPDIRWNRSLDSLADKPEQQLELLRHAVTLLKPGGALVYSTCSIEAEENEEVIAALLADNPEFKVCNAQGLLPEAAKSFVSPNGYLQTLPCNGLDGFFAVRLEYTNKK